MIENIYTNIPEKKEEYAACGRKPPKNVRQVGCFSGDLRIYLEDYVHTFTHWLIERDFSKRCLAVLVGEFAGSGQEKSVYACGAIALDGVCEEGPGEITSEQWAYVYETMKKYFAEKEIVGWFYGGTGFNAQEHEKMCGIHLDNFAGNDRIFMLYDYLEQEEAFYRYENGGLAKQTGYYIYYEKNTEMQNYMVDKKQGRTEREKVDDHAVNEMRALFGAAPGTEEKSDGRKADKRAEQPTDGSRLLYMFGIVVAAVAVVSGASVIYSQERLRGFEQTLDRFVGREIVGTGIPEQSSDGQSHNIFEDVNSQEVFHGADKSSTPIPTKEIIPSVSPTPSLIPDPTEKPESVDEKNQTKENNDEAGTEKEGTQNGNITEEHESGQEENTEKNNNSGEEKENGEKNETGEVNQDHVYQVYVVKPGDTLAGICMRKYGSTENLELIKKLNKLRDENLIYVNQELLLP